MANPPAPRSSRAPDSADIRDDRVGVGVVERCQRAELSLAAGGSADLVCGAEGVTEPDAATIDAVARLALVARRHDLSLRIAGAPHALIDLLDLCGLADLLARLEAADSVEPGR